MPAAAVISGPETYVGIVAVKESVVEMRHTMFESRKNARLGQSYRDYILVYDKNRVIREKSK